MVSIIFRWSCCVWLKQIYRRHVGAEHTSDVRAHPGWLPITRAEWRPNAFEQNLMDEEASKQPLMSERIPILVLRDEYEGGSAAFVKQIDFLQQSGYAYIRRTRRDGDCFYRCASHPIFTVFLKSDTDSLSALAFAWLERLLNSPKQAVEVAKAHSLLDSSLAVLKAAGFQELVYEDFYDVLISLIRQIVVPEPNGSTLTAPVLLEAFQDAEGALYTNL